MTELDSAQIQQLIPHRPPFLLIDRVVEIETGKRVICEKTVDSERDWFLQGHFPGEPLQEGGTQFFRKCQALVGFSTRQYFLSSRCAACYIR